MTVEIFLQLLAALIQAFPSIAQFVHDLIHGDEMAHKRVSEILVAKSISDELK